MLKLDLVSSKDEYEAVRPQEKDRTEKMMTLRRLDGREAMNISHHGLVGELHLASGHGARAPLNLYYRRRASIGRISLP